MHWKLFVGFVRHPYLDQASESFRGLTLSYKVHLWVIIFVALAAVVLRASHWGSEWMALAGCILILLTGFPAVFLPYRQQVGPIASSRSLVLVGLIGTAFAILNQYTKLPLGQMEFAHRWCPFLLIAMWAVLVFACVIMVRKWLHGIGCIVGTGVVIGLLSLLATTSAGAVGLWGWKAAGPLANNTPILFPIGWFAVSCLAGAVVDQSLSHESVEYREPAYAFWLQAGLMLLLYVIFTFIK